MTKNQIMISKKPEKSSPKNTWKWAFPVHCKEPPATMLFFNVWTLNYGCLKIWNSHHFSQFYISCVCVNVAGNPLSARPVLHSSNSVINYQQLSFHSNNILFTANVTKCNSTLPLWIMSFNIPILESSGPSLVFCPIWNLRPEK